MKKSVMMNTRTELGQLFQKLSGRVLLQVETSNKLVMCRVFSMSKTLHTLRQARG